MVERQKAAYSIECVNHALDILERFQGGVGELGFNDFQISFGLTKNYLRKLLVTLEKHEIIEADPSSKNYRLGVRAFELGHSCNEQSRLLHTIRPVLTNLSHESGEACCLAVMKDDHICISDVVESGHSVRVAYDVGSVLPAYTFAAGKVHLAGMNLNGYLSTNRLFPRTSNSITSADDLRWNLRQVAKDGYALDREETDEGVVSIGAPIVTHTGRVMGAVCVYGPVGRFSDERMKAVLIPLVKMAAQAVSGRTESKGLRPEKQRRRRFTSPELQREYVSRSKKSPLVCRAAKFQVKVPAQEIS